MQFTTTSATTNLLAALLSTSVSAAPAPQITVTPGATTPWPVANFELGCSPGGCTYAFNISGPATVDVGPAFSTFCSGTDVQNKLVPCADLNVQANLVPTTTDGLVLVVNRYGPSADGNTGVMSGNATAAPAGEPAYPSFTIEAKFYGEIVVSGSK